jgi:pyrimidine operon attenuation protein/uracil phosphoribosyltransferase
MSEDEQIEKSLRLDNPNRAKELIDAGWNLVCNENQIKRSVVRISHEILERNAGVTNIAIVGIRTRGEILSRRIVNYIESVEKKRPPLGVVDITLYRDDFGSIGDTPELLETQLPFNVDKFHIVLVDDVLFTGRTIRAALDAIIDFGRPRSVQLAVLCDRGHRELPIRADYVGKNLPTSRSDNVRVCMKEKDGQDAVFVGNFPKKKHANVKTN